EKQMSLLRGRTIPTSALAELFAGRGAPRVVITFDDAFANLIPNALPALREHNLPAAIFAVSTNFGVPPRWAMPNDHPERLERVMTEDELKSVAVAPDILIGSHTRTHPSLSDVAPDQLQRELTQSAAELE